MERNNMENSKEVRVYDESKLYLDGKPTIWTSIESDDVSIMYYSERTGGKFSIPLRLLIEVYEERMGDEL
jgi:hypothetical protein